MTSQIRAVAPRPLMTSWGQTSTASNDRRRLGIGVRRRLKIGSGRGPGQRSVAVLSLCVQPRGVEEVLLKAAGVQECLAHPLPLGS